MDEVRKYTVSQALKCSRYSTYLKGKEYCRSGKVDIVDTNEVGVVAIVNGTNEYKVILTWNGDDLLYECSCPFDMKRGGACKHVVATILKLAGDSENKIKIETGKEWQLPDLTIEQAKQFITKIVSASPDLQEELRIFLHRRSKKIENTDYDERFASELAQIDLNELLESWYKYNEMTEYGDGDYGDSMDEGDEENQLAMWVADIVDLMQKHIKYDDYGETARVGGAAARALIAKEQQLLGGMSDLGDWFDSGISQIIEEMRKLNEALSRSQLAIAKKEWEKLLWVKGNEDYLGLIVPAMADVLALSGEYEELEKHVNKFVSEYPPVALPQLEYLLRSGQKEKLIELAEAVLAAKEQSWGNKYFKLHNHYDNKDLMIRVRRILTKVYAGAPNRSKRIENLEELFLVSQQITDYEMLRSEYLERSEKEIFWRKMAKQFGQYGVKSTFEVYKLEGEKERILQLIERYPEAENFAKMIREVRDQYPEKCFEVYRGKIDQLLIPTNTAGYDNIAYHLSEMREIGRREQFAEYVESVKQKYKKRRCLMEALARKKL